MILYQISKWLELRQSMHRLAQVADLDQDVKRSCKLALQTLDDEMLARFDDWHDTRKSKKILVQ
jgi:hypothetical protein